MKSLYRKYPALISAVLFSSGITAAWHYLHYLSPALLPGLFTASILLVVISYFLFKPAFPWLTSLFFFVAGMASLVAHLTLFQPEHLVHQKWSKIRAISGRVEQSSYSKSGRHRYVLACDSALIDSSMQVVSGRVLLRQADYPGRFSVGQRLFIRGKVHQPALPGNPGEFNYRRYLHLRNIYFQMTLYRDNVRPVGRPRQSFLEKTFLTAPRRYVRNLIDGNFDSPSAGIIKALVLAERRDIDRDIITSFQKSGVVHVLAISGLHVGFILMMLLLVFGLLRLPYSAKIVVSLLVLFYFVALVDFKAPVLRAALMAAFYFTGRLLQRPGNSLNVLGAAALLILVSDPGQLLTPGFQFSFAAVGAIVYGYPRISNFWPPPAENSRLKKWLNRYIRQPLLVSLAAVLGTVPLTWFYYGSLQTGAVLINLIVIPLIGMLVMLVFLFIFLAMLPLHIAAGLALLLDQGIKMLLTMIDGISRLPYIQIELAHPGVLLTVLTVLFIILLFNLNGSAAKLAMPLLLFVILALYHIGLQQNKLRVTFINVGQGDACLVRFPGGRNLLVDGGEKKLNFDAGRRYILPLLKYAGVRRISYLVGTHAHSDHIGGLLTILKNVDIDTLVLNGFPAHSDLSDQLRLTAARRNIPIAIRKRGDRLFAGPQARVYILHPFSPFATGKDYSGREVNNSSLVLKICYGSTSFLLTGDLEQTAEQVVGRYGDFLKSQVLKVGHHGSKTSTSLSFLQKIRPRYSVISVGAKNPFFHPSRKTVKRLLVHGAHPLRTDRFGAIVFESDGHELRLINWRL